MVVGLATLIWRVRVAGILITAVMAAVVAAGVIGVYPVETRMILFLSPFAFVAFAAPAPAMSASPCSTSTIRWRPPPRRRPAGSPTRTVA
jgi:hypothetical membrane protein